METNSQLIKKIKEGGYNNVYPIAYIDGIIDKESNEKLSDILIRYNNIMVPWQGDVASTRNRVPSLMRRQGIVITYITDLSEIVTEVYKGTVEDIKNNWADNINWELVPDLKFVQDNASKLPDGTITPEKLSPALQELISQSGSIVNMPDDEDLEQKDMVLKFKDRPYNSELASGKGYKILRKNWTEVGTKTINLLTQDVFNQSNTIYEIRYDFDLNGAEITIPEDCVLDFQGGSLNNGKIVGNRTSIQSFLFNIFGLDIEFAGNWNLREVPIEWFGGGVNSTASINSDAIDKAITLLSQYGGTIKFNGHIRISRSIDLRSHNGICLEGTYTNLVNPAQTWNTIIIKNGNFDAVILGSWCSMRNISVSSIAQNDTSDGIWVIGFGCILENVGVNDQGGNGIKVGNKATGEDRSADCCTFYSVKSIHNEGWGLYISDEQITNDSPYTADTNACSFYGIDIRDNTLGGIFIDKCIDNHFYSPTVHVNGNRSVDPILADIVIGSKANGHHFYSPYCESSHATYGIYLHKGSNMNRVIGVRAAAGNNSIYDANEEDNWQAQGYNHITYNYKNWRGDYIPSFTNFKRLNIVNPNYVVGPCSLSLSDTGDLSLSAKSISIKHPSATSSAKFEQGSDGMVTPPAFTSLAIMGEQAYHGIRIKNDMINNIKVRAYCATRAVDIPANSTLEVITTTNLNDQCYGYIISNPGDGPLPSGISYYTRQEKAGEIKFYFVNSTTNSVHIPQTRWNVLFLGTIILV